MKLFKKATAAALALSMCFLTACGTTQDQEPTEETEPNIAFYTEPVAAEIPAEYVSIELSDEEILVDGTVITSDEENAVYAANDIVYYEAGKDFTYGEGSESDEHSAEEAAAHTVVHITQPGAYMVSGTLRQGQIAVDLGKDAEEDPDAVVTLILNGMDISCSVAPAVIFYNVYECGSSDEETATMYVDTAAAGANVIIADGTTNKVTGSYVARIYKPESVELNEKGTEVVDAKKLHKYDGAFYSKMSMNVNGGELGDGTLYIDAENEGLDSELHLTLNGGNVVIEAGNDGINASEDYVSVTTVNGGSLTITVTGETGEGDGIDSNGWLIINGGSVVSSAWGESLDSGIDSDMGIHIFGGNVVATGNMMDHIENGGQNYTAFSFSERQQGGTQYTLKAADGSVVASCVPANDFSILLVSGASLTPGNYTLWQGETQLEGASGGKVIPGFGMIPEGFKFSEMSGNMEKPEGFEIHIFKGEITLPSGQTVKIRLKDLFGKGDVGEISSVFSIAEGGNIFSGVATAE